MRLAKQHRATRRMHGSPKVRPAIECCLCGGLGAVPDRRADEGEMGQDVLSAVAVSRQPRRRSGPVSRPGHIRQHVAQECHSATSRAKTPTWSSVRDCSSTPARLIRPWVGLNPTTPQKLAGRITEPLVWVPTPTGTSIGHRRGRAARRAPGCPRRIAWVARLAGMDDGQLGRHRLAEEDCPGRAHRLTTVHRGGRRPAHSTVPPPSACPRCR